MKTTFTVPEEGMVPFVDVLLESSFSNEIIGTTEENEILIEVHYTKAQHKEIEELMDIVEPEEEETGEFDNE